MRRPTLWRPAEPDELNFAAADGMSIPNFSLLIGLLPPISQLLSDI